MRFHFLIASPVSRPRNIGINETDAPSPRKTSAVGIRFFRPVRRRPAAILYVLQGPATTQGETSRRFLFRYFWVVILATSMLFACGSKTSTSSTPTQAPEFEAPTSTTPEPASNAALSAAQQSSSLQPLTPGVAALELARKSGCLACHSIEKKIVGPAWKDVAARYKNVPFAQQQLITKVKVGGKGSWTEVTGGIAMPPYSPRVTDADIKTLVEFVLAL